MMDSMKLQEIVVSELTPDDSFTYKWLQVPSLGRSGLPCTTI